MESVKHFVRNSSPLVKMLMAISITSGLVVCHRWWYAPYVRRQKFLQAEAWANDIFEQEEKLRAEGKPIENVGNRRYVN